MSEIKGRTIKLFLKGSNFKFEGKCLGIEDGFIRIFDQKTQKEIMFYRDQISQVELLRKPTPSQTSRHIPTSFTTSKTSEEVLI